MVQLVEAISVVILAICVISAVAEVFKPGITGTPRFTQSRRNGLR